MKLKTYLTSHKKTNYLFTNSKTSGVSVDFGICGFMHFDKKNRLTSKVCQGCYSATLLNIYNATREKLISNGKRLAFLNEKEIKQDVKLFEEDIKNIAEMGVSKLRFYALSDFSPRDMPYILAASKHLTVDIISKSLVLPMNEQYLLKLNNKKNVWISLSFNFNFHKEFERIEEILKSKQSRNIQLNWTINYKNKEQREDPRIKRVQVVHVTNKDKRGALEYGLSEHRVCGVFDEKGQRAKKGVCDSCNNCHLSYRAHQVGRKAKLPDALAS